MKSKYILCIVCLVLFLSVCINPQSYLMTVENISVENPHKIEFDIFLKSNSEKFVLESYQVTLSLSSETLIIENLSFAYNEGTSQLHNVPAYGIGVYGTDGAPEMAFASSPEGTDTITSENKRVGKFSLTNTQPFDTTLHGITWNFDGVINTILTTSGNVEFTNQSDHNIIRDNQGPLPVELTLFEAKTEGKGVILNWKTATELNNYGFEIEKSPSSSPSQREEISETTPRGGWGAIGFLRGNGNSSKPIEYRFVDESSEPGKWLYRLKQIDLDGTYSYSGIVEVEINSAPRTFNLSQNYPNPFNPETVIEFTIPENGNAVLKVFSITGEEVATLFDEFAESGKLYRVKFSAVSGSNNNLAAGIYLARLQFGDSQLIKKMTYLK